MAKLSENTLIAVVAAVGAYFYFAKDFFKKKKADIDPSAPALIDSKKGSSLRKGDKGEAVVAWQRKLCAYSEKYRNEPSLGEYRNVMTGWDDGKFDEDVAEWTRFFQGEVGITDDGIVGPQTAMKMDQTLRAAGFDPKKVAQDESICA